MRTQACYYSPETDHAELEAGDHRWSSGAVQKQDGSRWVISEDELEETLPSLTRSEKGPAEPLEIGADKPGQAAAKTARATSAFRDLQADIENGEITPEAAALAYNRIFAELIRSI
jgi:hypothetical protein